MNNLSNEQIEAVRLIFSTLTPDNVRGLLWSNGHDERTIRRVTGSLREVYNTLNQRDKVHENINTD